MIKRIHWRRVLLDSFEVADNLINASRLSLFDQRAEIRVDCRIQESRQSNFLGTPNTASQSPAAGRSGFVPGNGWKSAGK